jgi:CrcB protein
MRPYLLVMLGAPVGGLARDPISAAVRQRLASRFALGALAVHVSGCFLIGIRMPVFTGRCAPRPDPPLLRITGVFGGYTAFSSFAWESFQAVDEGGGWIGCANIALRVLFGYLAVWSARGWRAGRA